MDETLRTERRAFARVTALASWRSEYILRTRLLRSLARGKPVQTIASPSAARAGQSHVATPIVMYNSQMFTTVNHMHAAFGSGLNKRPPRFVHGADDVGTASSSDPATGKIDSWGLGDPTTFIQFSDRYPGDAQYGLGSGDIVGVPNTMDVSQPYGMVHGEGSPEGLVYFRFTEEMRGRFLAPSTGLSVPDLGIPKIALMREATCSVWIAKSSAIPSLTDGLIGIMSGSSLGVLTTYSLGPLGARDQHFGRGEITARWVLSPGVPIVALAVDEQYSLQRQARNRVWAAALNALGEVFYLTKFPKPASLDKALRLDEEGRESSSWATGRTVYWNVVEPSRRVARPNPYDDSRIDGSYSPRTSWTGMCLSKEQVKAETREIEDYLSRKPKDFQRSCLGWDMRRRLEVDFAGDDGNNAGESIVVFDCGLDEDSISSAKRYARCKTQDRKTLPSADGVLSLTDESTQTSTEPSLFGGSSPLVRAMPAGASPQLNAQTSLSFSLSQDNSHVASESQFTSEEWRTSTFNFGGIKSVQIVTTTLDCSTYATLTTSEDPLLNMSSGSTTSSPSLTPLSQSGTSASSADIPGQRARFVAAGTKMGSVLVWNMRAPVSRSSEIVNVIEPIRIIHTDSPEISCLAMSSLYLVHGGNDGLVQAWDPLASNMSPMRTLNSRFSSRARRRLVQAQASPQGVGINLFAAGAICLDPDATVLRGMVSIGTHLRYWSYSSSAADQYKSHKRRMRRSERGSNIGGERVANAPRSNMKDYIASEQYELEQEANRHAKEAAHLAGRFGTELLGSDASEEELLAYATMLSEEALAKDLQTKHTEPSTSNGFNESVWSSDIATPEGSANGRAQSSQAEDEFDADVAEAIRLSLENEQRAAAEWEEEQASISQQTNSPGFEIPIRYGKGRKASPHKDRAAESSNTKELSDLEFAMQLSMAEEASRREAEEADGEDVFPALEPAVTRVWLGKGKGRAG